MAPTNFRPLADLGCHPSAMLFGFSGERLVAQIQQGGLNFCLFGQIDTAQDREVVVITQQFPKLTEGLALMPEFVRADSFLREEADVLENGELVVQALDGLAGIMEVVIPRPVVAKATLAHTVFARAASDCCRGVLPTVPSCFVYVRKF